MARKITGPLVVFGDGGGKGGKPEFKQHRQSAIDLPSSASEFGIRVRMSEFAFESKKKNAALGSHGEKADLAPQPLHLEPRLREGDHPPAWEHWSIGSSTFEPGGHAGNQPIGDA